MNDVDGTLYVGAILTGAGFFNGLAKYTWDEGSETLSFTSSISFDGLDSVQSHNGVWGVAVKQPQGI